MEIEPFQRWLEAWDLTPDGEPYASSWSQLLPVRRGDQLLMLKAAMAEQEVAGSAFLAWLQGRGAAHVHERQDDAVLMERLFGPTALADLTKDQGDAAAFTVLRNVADAIHSAPAELRFANIIPMEQWFAALAPAAANAGGVFIKAASTFEALAASTGQRVHLHGDLHHGNVMRRADGTWAAIDPKGILGDRTLEFAMMLFVDVAVDGGIGDAPGVIARVSAASSVAGVDRERLLAWSFCQSALYAAWFAGHPHEALWRPLAEGLEAAAPEPRTLS